MAKYFNPKTINTASDALGKLRKLIAENIECDDLAYEMAMLLNAGVALSKQEVLNKVVIKATHLSQDVDHLTKVD